MTPTRIKEHFQVLVSNVPQGQAREKQEDTLIMLDLAQGLLLDINSIAASLRTIAASTKGQNNGRKHTNNRE